MVTAASETTIPPQGKLHLSIFSPERKLLENFEVETVTLTGSEGQIQVLPGHVRMVGTLETGAFGYEAGASETFSGFVSTGFFEVQNDTVSVIAETLEIASEIDVDRAREAEKRGLEALAKPDLSLDDMQKFQRKVQRARARIDVAEAHRSRGSN